MPHTHPWKGIAWNLECRLGETALPTHHVACSCGNAAQKLECRWGETALPTHHVACSCGNAAQKLECWWGETALPTHHLTFSCGNKTSNVKFCELKFFQTCDMLEINGYTICRSHEIPSDT